MEPIYLLLTDKTSKDVILFTVVASSHKHSIESDFNRVSIKEVEKLTKVREYMCAKMGLMDDVDNATTEAPQTTAIVPVLMAQIREKAAIEMQLGELQIRFNDKPDAEQLKVVLAALMGANKLIC